MSAARGLGIYQVDIKSAYLNSPVKEEIYIRTPEGLNLLTNHEQVMNVPSASQVLKLNQSLYGLKQSGRNWHTVLTNWLSQQGFGRSQSDPCLYVATNPQDGVEMVAFYVDDILVISQSEGGYKAFLTKVKERFEVTALGRAKWFLGVGITETDQHLCINQERYVEQMLKTYHMEDANDQSTPLSTQKADYSNEVGDSREPPPPVPYRNLVGSLLYASNWTRLDISFSVSFLSRFLEEPTTAHWRMAKRALRYLKGTKGACIAYPRHSDRIILEGFSDSDWAGDEHDRKSTSGYVFLIGEAPVSWATRKQKSVALSTAEAEYMALSAAVQESIFLRRLLGEIGAEQKEPTVIHVDNQACISM